MSEKGFIAARRAMGKLVGEGVTKLARTSDVSSRVLAFRRSNLLGKVAFDALGRGGENELLGE